MESTATPSPTTFYKLMIKGIVYLIDPDTAIAYLHDDVAPVPVGIIHWMPSMSNAVIEFFKENVKEGDTSGK